jgi:hypothetical protein
VAKIFDKNGVVAYGTLDHGTLEKNQRVLADYYYSNNINVLLLNSLADDGCGLNLEMVTNIVLLHYTDERLMEQVICRGQRPGRRVPLHVISIYHENEIVERYNNKTA